MVTLSKQTVKKPGGKTYRYWILRWMGSDGKRHCQSLGRADKRSKRQAEVLRRMKEAELQGNPGRRDVSRGHTLSAFLERYFSNRRDELASGTIDLQKHTARYLEAFLGVSCRIDTVTRLDARAFKTALASGELMHVSKRPRSLKPATVDLHIRNARSFFNHALRDDLILFNPFDRLGSSQPVERDWHYVDAEEFAKLLGAASTMSWRLLLALARWAALRRGEAINLRWHNIDWDRNLLTVISSDDWEVKDKDPRVVPICPELHGLLLDAFEQAPEGDRYVIPQESNQRQEHLAGLRGSLQAGRCGSIRETDSYTPQELHHGLGGAVCLPRRQGMGRALKHRDDRTALPEGPRRGVRACRLNGNDARSDKTSGKTPGKRW